MSRRLVEDFGYPISHLRTRPQWRVATSPSESKKYPVDITVFSSEKHTAENVTLVVECKRRNRKDGTEQLKRYLTCPTRTSESGSTAKIIGTSGKSSQKTAPGSSRPSQHPRYGQRVEDIGLYRKKDLVKPSNLRSVFRDIRNHLAGNAPWNHARRAARTRSHQSAVLQDLR